MAAEKPSNIMHKRDSVRFWILVVICAYFGLAVYWAYNGLNFGISLTSDQYVYGLLSKGPWWWMIIWYFSEGISGVAAAVFRAVAGCFAFYSAFLFWRRNESSLSLIRGKVCTALLLEGCYFLSFIPSIVAAFVYYLAETPNLYYFDHAPGLLLLLLTGVSCLMMVMVIPPLLFRLRSKIIQGSPSQEIIKWSCLTGVSYLFVVFWFNYSIAWVANMIPYWHAQGQYGLSFLLEPVNLASFIVTVFGLFLIATSALIFTLPAIKKPPSRLNLRRVGAVMMAFGGYFVFSLLYYYLTGEYAAHPNVWYEIIGPVHNPNLLWCVTFLFLGLALLTSRKSRG